MDNSPDVALVERVIEHLRRDPSRYSAELAPHAKADALSLPDGSAAPASLRAWARFDNRYPWYLATRRSDQLIADPRGKLLAKPMKRLLKWVCLDSIRDEIEDDDETIAYLKERIGELADELPGHGVYLEPSEHPDRVLWLPPGGEATLIWYENDEFTRREPFARWVADLFEVGE